MLSNPIDSPLRQLDSQFPDRSFPSLFNNKTTMKEIPISPPFFNKPQEEASKPIAIPELKNYTNEPVRTNLFCVKIGRRKPASLLPDRKIWINQSDKEVPNNYISTSKYNIITFLPMNLFEQFSKAANLYFLLIGALQVIPTISNTNGQPLQYVPLIFIILLSMIKDLFEDFKRHKSDYEENHKKVLVWTDKMGFEMKFWKDIYIGDIIKVNQNEYFPADILLLKTSDPKGISYIETKNLDGETNLKHKLANKELITQYSKEESLGINRILFSYEKPNPFLYNFIGSANSLKNGALIGLDHQNFVLRGCSLRNTEWIIGVVAYTGHDTKIMLNSTKAKPKKSQVDKIMNKQIVLVFLLLILISLFAAIYCSFWFSSNKDTLTYLEVSQYDNENDIKTYLLISFGTWILLLANFVPISLIVTLELVKFMQAIIMSKDENLCSKADSIYTTVQSSNLNEELGQIQYIFSDKTGTLTCNIMDFKKFTVGGVSYGEKSDLMPEEILNLPNVTNVDFKDKSLFTHLNDPIYEYSLYIRDSLIFLSMCHSVIAEEKNNNYVYNASSPDELALVNFAKYMGFEFQGLDEYNYLNVKIKNEGVLRYKFLHELEFNSTRKRHSVIVEDDKGNIQLLCKGADSIIYERLDKKDPLIKKTWVNLDKYAVIGLRTLVLAKRIIPREEYDGWSLRYTQALGSLSEREINVQKLQDEIELNMTLVAATAIEDKLQDNVGKTISILKEAGLKLWVLTGDKIETAINIAFSCELLTDKLEQIVVDGQFLPDVINSIESGITLVLSEKSNNPEYALIISGSALVHAMNPDLSPKLMILADCCKAVLACRVSPKQKQEIVTLVRTEKPNVITLAIGDGANDVNMISAAHVGIGIRGKEGQQAARASDYAIGEFKLLRRLLLYSGRESYRKNSILICYNFYKNVILVMPFFWFGIYNGFSGQLLYDPWIFQFFNVFYASLPIMLFALFDEEYPNTKYLEIKNAPANQLENLPQCYELGRLGKMFGTKVFWSWIINALGHSVILMFFCFLALEGLAGFDGENQYLISTGMMIFTMVVVISNIKILIFSKIHTNISILIIILSIIFYVGNFFIFNLFKELESYNNFLSLHLSVYYYLGCFLIIGYTMVTDMIIWRYLILNEKKPSTFNRVMPLIENEQIDQMEESKSLKKNEENGIKMIRRDSKKFTGYAFNQDEPISKEIIVNYKN